MGILIALAGLTRLTLYLSAMFFALELLKTKNFKQILLFCLPIVLSVLLLGAYNYKRFHNPFESGYKYNVTLKSYPMANNLAEGFFSLKHVPANVYMLLFKSPDPVTAGAGFIVKPPFLKADPWGMAIWFTSPLLLLLFRLKRLDENKSALLATLVLLIPCLLYFGVGFSQFGYRYSLDFLPFLFLILLPALKPKLGLLAKLLITIGVIFNSVYIASMWGIYPVL